jgi:hypothetical protein
MLRMMPAGVTTNAAKLGLIALMVLGALMLWVGNPVIWLWIGSQTTGSQQARLGPYLLVGAGILGSTVAVSLALGRLSRTYERISGHGNTVRVRLPWMRSLRDEREPVTTVTVLDLILICTAIAAVVTFVIWLLFFAGSSLPGA